MKLNVTHTKPSWNRVLTSLPWSVHHDFLPVISMVRTWMLYSDTRLYLVYILLYWVIFCTFVNRVPVNIHIVVKDTLYKHLFVWHFCIVLYLLLLLHIAYTGWFCYSLHSFTGGKVKTEWIKSTTLQQFRKAGNKTDETLQKVKLFLSICAFTCTCHTWPHKGKTRLHPVQQHLSTMSAQ